MSTVAIVYFSGTGKTAALAKAVIAGAASVAGTTVLDLPIRGAAIVEGRFTDEALLAKVDGADAVIFGTPTYMGGVAAQFKAFADASGGRWYHRSWQDKFAGGFTTSASPSGDKQGSLLYLATLAAQHGMLWAGQTGLNELAAGKPADQAVNRLGSFLGVMSQVNPTPEGAPTPGDLRTAELYGARLAGLAAKR